jgi:hypothetical protein
LKIPPGKKEGKAKNCFVAGSFGARESDAEQKAFFATNYYAGLSLIKH